MAIDRGPWNALVDDDGSNLTGSIWNKAAIKTVILDPVDAAIPVVPVEGAMIAYTPTFSSAGGPATLGNGTLAGQYRLRGKRVEGYLRFEWGSTTAVPPGVFYWTLPLPAGVVHTTTHKCIGYATILDVSAGAYAAMINVFNATAVVAYNTDAISTGLGPTSPWAWATGDHLMAAFAYEID